MTKLKKLLISSLTCLASGCASVSIPDINPGVTLPYSGDGYRRTTLTNVSTVVPKAQWDQQKRRAILLFAEDWAQLKYVLLKNCLTNKCKSTAGALDNLFYTLDEQLKKLPSPLKK